MEKEPVSGGKLNAGIGCPRWSRWGEPGGATFCKEIMTGGFCVAAMPKIDPPRPPSKLRPYPARMTVFGAAKNAIPMRGPKLLRLIFTSPLLLTPGVPGTRKMLAVGELKLGIKKPPAALPVTVWGK